MQAVGKKYGWKGENQNAMSRFEIFHFIPFVSQKKELQEEDKEEKQDRKRMREDDMDQARFLISWVIPTRMWNFQTVDRILQYSSGAPPVGEKALASSSAGTSKPSSVAYMMAKTCNRNILMQWKIMCNKFTVILQWYIVKGKCGSNFQGFHLGSHPHLTPLT